MHVVSVSQILLKRPSLICPFENNKLQVLFLYKGQRSTFSEVFSKEDRVDNHTRPPSCVPQITLFKPPSVPFL